MKIKHVLFSSLLLSTAFVACTNEDFETNGVLNTEEAISLGEGFTISGSLGTGISTKAIYEDATTGTVVDMNPLWEPKDTVGAAWYAAMTAPAQGQTVAQGFTFNSNKFASNHPFDRVDKNGNVETAEFQTVTNAFAGKYVLYFPYNSTVASVSDAIPVEMPTAQTMDVAEPLKHVNENIMFYTNQEYSVGGNQAGNFEMNPIPVMYRLTFSADENARGIVGQDISMIVVESSKLYSAGEITAEGSGYADITAKYNGTTTTGVYTLTIEGNENNKDYQISATGDEGRMKKPFYLSVLPAASDISSLMFKVVTADGKVYTREISNLGNSDMATVKANLTSEGGLFAANITLNAVATTGGEIYTEQQFMNAWNAAVSTGNGTIELGAPLSLDELTLETQGVNINITGAQLNVKTLNVEDGTLSVADLKADNVNVPTYGVLSADKISVAETLEVGGSVTISDVDALKNVNVKRKGQLSLTGGKVTGTFTTDVESEISLNGMELANTNDLNGAIETTTAAVDFTGTTTIKGVLTTNAATEFAGLTITGELAAGTGNITLKGNTINNGKITKSSGSVTINAKASLTNKGELCEVENNGTLNLDVTTKSEITNNAELYVNTGDITTPSAAAADLDITNVGTVYFNLPNSNNNVTVAGLNNTGKVEINKGTVVEKANTNISGVGEIYIGTDGKLQFAESASAHGLGNIIITKAAADALFNNHNDDKLSCYYSDWAKVTASDIDNVIFDADATVSETDCTAIQDKNLIIRGNLVLGGNITMGASTKITVEKEVLLTSNKQVTISGTSGAKIETTENAVLKIGTGVTLVKTNFTTGSATIVKVGGNVTE